MRDDLTPDAIESSAEHEAAIEAAVEQVRAALVTGRRRVPVSPGLQPRVAAVFSEAGWIVQCDNVILEQIQFSRPVTPPSCDDMRDCGSRSPSQED